MDYLKLLKASLAAMHYEQYGYGVPGPALNAEEQAELDRLESEIHAVSKADMEKEWAELREKYPGMSDGEIRNALLNELMKASLDAMSAQVASQIQGTNAILVDGEKRKSPE